MYSAEVKHRAVIHYLNFFRSIRKVSKLYKCSKSSLSRWINQTLYHKIPSRRNRNSTVDAIKQAVSCILSSQPFCTMREVVQKLKSDGVNVSSSTAWRASKKANFTRKRVRPRFSPKEASPQQAASFMAELEDAKENISVDETCVYFNDSPRYGYSLKGQRCYHRPKGPRRTGKVTLVMAISESRGVIGHKVVEGSFDSKGFAAFIASLEIGEGSSIILDNAACHRTRHVRDTATHKGVKLLFIPPYSPEFNPIENAFSVLKAALRSPETNDLEVDIKRITSSKCQAFFRETRRYVCELASRGR
nr:putative transposase [Oceanusvirus sp.]